MTMKNLRKLTLNSEQSEKLVGQYYDLLYSKPPVVTTDILNHRMKSDINSTGILVIEGHNPYTIIYELESDISKLVFKCGLQ